jgi:hypothetical protein
MSGELSLWEAAERGLCSADIAANSEDSNAMRKILLQTSERIVIAPKLSYLNLHRSLAFGLACGSLLGQWLIFPERQAIVPSADGKFLEPVECFYCGGSI